MKSMKSPELKLKFQKFKFHVVRHEPSRLQFKNHYKSENLFEFYYNVDKKWLNFLNIIHCLLLMIIYYHKFYVVSKYYNNS